MPESKSSSRLGFWNGLITTDEQFDQALTGLISQSLDHIGVQERSSLLDIDIDAYLLDPTSGLSRDTVAIRMTTVEQLALGIAASTLVAPQALSSSQTQFAQRTDVLPSGVLPSEAALEVFRQVQLSPVASISDQSSSDAGLTGAEVGLWCERVASSCRTFATLGTPWARRCGTLGQLQVAEQNVGFYRDGAAMSPIDGPRPYLHPLSTLGGVPVTDAAPSDHTWHVGVAMGVQDVAGWNLWGGRTFLTEGGSTWLADHGRIEHQKFITQDHDSFSERLIWLDAHGLEILQELRQVSWRQVEADHEYAGWELDFATTLENHGAAPIELGSAGSHGKPGGGYGGFFWRLPAIENTVIATDSHEDEDACHGNVSPYLAWSAHLAGDSTASFTLISQGLDSQSQQDPWFIRCAGYPAFGSALAWEEPVVVTPEVPLRRSWRTLIMDGAYNASQLREIAARWMNSR